MELPEIRSLVELEGKIELIYNQLVELREERDKYLREIKKRDNELLQIEKKLRKYIKERKMMKKKINPLLDEIDNLNL